MHAAHAVLRQYVLRHICCTLRLTRTHTHTIAHLHNIVGTHICTNTRKKSSKLHLQEQAASYKTATDDEHAARIAVITIFANCAHMCKLCSAAPRNKRCALLLPHMCARFRAQTCCERTIAHTESTVVWSGVAERELWVLRDVLHTAGHCVLNGSIVNTHQRRGRFCTDSAIRRVCACASRA